MLEAVAFNITMHTGHSETVLAHPAHLPFFLSDSGYERGGDVFFLLLYLDNYQMRVFDAPLALGESQFEVDSDPFARAQVYKGETAVIDPEDRS